MYTESNENLPGLVTRAFISVHSVWCKVSRQGVHNGTLIICLGRCLCCT